MAGEANRRKSNIAVSIGRCLVRGSTSRPKKTAVVACTRSFAIWLQRKAQLKRSRSEHLRQFQIREYVDEGR